MSGLAPTLPSRAAGRRLPWVVAGAGLLCLAAATGPDLVRGVGLSEIGPLQLLLTAMGAAGVVAAPWLASPRSEAVRARWAAMLADRDATLADVRPLAVVLAQVIALTLLARAFRIESPVFYGRVLPFVAVAFVVHHFMPRPLRIWAFMALSIGSVLLVFGVVSGLWLVGLGVSLVAAAHVPLPWKGRVALVLALAVALGLARAGIVTAPWDGAVWPILGSMFMFRMVLYLYDLRHQKGPVHWGRSLSYFFLLPNVAFPLFPVVDFSTFRRTHYDRPALGIYQQGVEWMLRGLTHLVGYRLVYKYGTMSPGDVHGTVDLVRYMVANFGLYLRVSGQFHLVVGVMHLFGFRLPETHRFFYLASSFTDFWRRINIYWKEFMTKVVFYPTFHRTKRFGETAGLVVATLVVFFVTWATHSYQWFWLLGTWLFSATDALFWGILAVLLVWNSLREIRHGRQRTISQVVPTGVDAWSLGLRTAGTFLVICVLWSLWTAPTIGDWTSMLATATLGVTDVAVVLGVLGLVGGAAVLAARAPRERRMRPVTVLATALLPAVGIMAGGRPEADQVLSVGVRELMRDVTSAELNRSDAEMLQRGYYEQLVGVNRFNGQLWELYAQKSEKDWWNLEELGVLEHSDEPRESRLRPLRSVIYNGASFTTNQWGMRDQDYTARPAAGVRRVALLGQSYVEGSGVGDGQTFESVLERRVNADSTLQRHGRLEILNFGSEGYSLLQQLALLESGAIDSLGAHAIVLAGHWTDFDRNVTYLSARRAARQSVPWAPVAALLDSIGVVPGMERPEAERRLAPFKERLVVWAMGALQREAQSRGLRMAYIGVPTPNPIDWRPRMDRLHALAREAGFHVVDLGNVYEGVPLEQLWVAAWDRHPNAQGHRMIAERFHAHIAGAPAWWYGAPHDPAETATTVR